MTAGERAGRGLRLKSGFDSLGGVVLRSPDTVGAPATVLDHRRFSRCRALSSARLERYPLRYPWRRGARQSHGDSQIGGSNPLVTSQVISTVGPDLVLLPWLPAPLALARSFRSFCRGPGGCEFAAKRLPWGIRWGMALIGCQLRRGRPPGMAQDARTVRSHPAVVSEGRPRWGRRSRGLLSPRPSLD